MIIFSNQYKHLFVAVISTSENISCFEEAHLRVGKKEKVYRLE